MSEQSRCELCGEPMPEGEEMFKFHGYSGPCPKPPLRKPMNPAISHVLKFFKYDHLPPDLKVVSKRFHDLAQEVALLADNPEVAIALRNLLEAKDAALRSILWT